MRKCNFKVVWEILVPPELVSEKTKYDNNYNNNVNNNDNNYHNNNYNNNYYDWSASHDFLKCMAGSYTLMLLAKHFIVPYFRAFLHSSIIPSVTSLFFSLKNNALCSV